LAATAAMGDDGLVFVKQKLPSHGQMPPVAFQSSDGQLAASGPRFIIQGGQRRGITGEMWVLETNGDGWIQAFPDVANGFTTAIPERTQSTIVSLGNEPQSITLIFAGYVLNKGEQNDLWKSEHSLDPNTSSPVAANTEVEAEGTPPAPRYGHSATMVGTNMIVVGGQSGTKQFNDVWSLSTNDPFVWTQVTCDGPAPSPRTRHTATLIKGGELLVMGGFSRKDRVVGDAFMLKVNGDSGSWRAWEPTEGALPPNRAQHTVTAHPDGEHVYVFGGYDGEKNSNDMWVMNVPKASSAEVKCTVKPETRSRHAAHIMGSQLWIFCGHDGMKPHLAEVWTLDVDDVRGHLANGLEAAKSAKKEKEDEKKEEEEDED